MKYPLEAYTLDTRQAAEMLGYKINHMRALAASGVIPCIKRFRNWIFCKEELEKFFIARTQAAVASGKASVENDADASDLLR